MALHAVWPCLVLFGLLAYGGYNRYLHPLAKVPGPFWASITPLWLVWQIWNRRRPQLDLDLHRKYGSVVRLSPNQVMFSNPEYFKTVYGAGTNFIKSRWYEAPMDKTDAGKWEKLDMLAEMNLDKLRLQKRHAGPVYSVNNAKRYESLINQCIQQWFERLSRLRDRPLNFYKEAEILFVDVMTAITYAKPFGAIERGSDGGQMHFIHEMWRWWSVMGTVPWFNELDKAWAPWSRIFTTLDYATALPVFGFAHGQVMEYDQKPKDSNNASCILDDLRKLSAEKPDFVQGWGTSLSITNEGAGIETSTWTFVTAVVAIVSNPDILRKVNQELTQALQDGLLEVNHPAPYDEAIKLPYLQACLNEAQRLWPNVSQPLLRQVPKEGITIEGYFIPAGYDVGMHSKQLGLSRQIFGDDVEVFKPERWLGISKQQRNTMETINLAFGGPARKCPGMHVAWLAVTKVTTSFFLDWQAKILNKLNGAPGPGGSSWIEQGTFTTTWPGLEISVHPREPKEAS